MKRHEEFQVKFFKEMMDYYLDSLERVSDSVENLAKIQQKYPEDYDRFKEMSMRPDILVMQSKNLPVKTKTILFELILQLQVLTQKSNNLYNLTATQKRELARNFRDYMKMLKEKLEDK